VERTLINATSDSLDRFTDEIVQKMAEKWKCHNIQKTIQCEIERSASDIYEQKLQDDSQSYSIDVDVNSVDELITKAIRLKEYKLIMPILNSSVRKKYCPSPELLLEAASIFSRDRKSVV
jgi:vacuolar-type H+-ATPase subunit D/Vma8